MSDARGMAHRSPPAIPDDLRTRLEAARLELLALFRTLDRMSLSAGEIPQRLLQQLFELDANCAEALWALDQPAGPAPKGLPHNWHRAQRVAEEAVGGSRQPINSCGRGYETKPAVPVGRLPGAYGGHRGLPAVNDGPSPEHRSLSPPDQDRLVSLRPYTNPTSDEVSPGESGVAREAKWLNG